MSHSERGSRRIASIPPQTILGVLRRGVTRRIGGDNLLEGARRVSREPITEEQDWNQIGAKSVFQKPPRREEARSGSLYERKGKIEWEPEIIVDYNGKGDLGLILRFSEIRFTETSFLKSTRNYGPDSAVFYSRIGYNNKHAHLILATRGDIFESQIVPAQMDVNPFFQEELHLPQLTTTHDPTSMTVFQNNTLLIVGYNPHTY